MLSLEHANKQPRCGLCVLPRVAPHGCCLADAGQGERIRRDAAQRMEAMLQAVVRAKYNAEFRFTRLTKPFHKMRFECSSFETENRRTCSYPVEYSYFTSLVGIPRQYCDHYSR
eukprot:3013154-Pleurochrysis_carterae.AAC.6